MNLYKKIRNVAFLIEPEKAHKLAISALKSGLHIPSDNNSKLLKQKVFGLTFNNPIGLAAGFDKNAEVPNEIISSGFGFTEVGTVTPIGQPGNKMPRVFRLPEDDALINRLGFNNDGMEIVFDRLSKITKKGIIGVNIGANKSAIDKLSDYQMGIKKFSKIADYITINISSPNTPGLRDLQSGQNFQELIKLIKVFKNDGLKTPVLIKLAPDLTRKQLELIIDYSMDGKIDGLILTNTTIERKYIKNKRYSNEDGGLSGKPLMQKSTKILRDSYTISEGKIPLIGVGGVSSSRDIIEKIRNGASLIQLYTAIVYEGPTLISKLKKELISEVEQYGVKSIADLVGTAIKK
tara:strand:+ start:6779 stop:7825 length:1047 start_codon:yes stop_codon:yes gene_type:complete